MQQLILDFKTPYNHMREVATCHYLVSLMGVEADLPIPTEVVELYEALEEAWWLQLMAEDFIVWDKDVTLRRLLAVLERMTSNIRETIDKYKQEAT